MARCTMHIIAACALLLQLSTSLQIDGATNDRNLVAAGINCNNMVMPADQTRSLALCGAMMTHEKRVRAVMDRLLDKFSTDVNVIDAGAWMGETAIHFAQHPKVKEVYAVDPSEKNCDFMYQTFELNQIKNIRILNQALGNKDGNYSADLPAKSRMVAGNYVWSPVVDRPQGEGSVGIAQGSTLDSLYAQGTFKNLALIHMDMKGTELQAIEGAHHLLKSRRPIVVAQVTLPEGGSNFLQMQEHLQNSGYVSYSVEESCLGPRAIISKVSRKCRNIIHIPKEFADLRQAVMNTNDAHVTELRPLVAGAAQDIDIGP